MTNQPTFSLPDVSIRIIELQPHTIAAPPSRLGEIFARPLAKWTLAEWLTAAYECLVAKPAWTTPTFKVTLLPPAVRRAQILAKRDEAVRAAWQRHAEATLPKPALSPADSFQGFNSITVKRIADARSLEIGHILSEVRPAPVCETGSRFSRCLECGESFTVVVNGEEKTTWSQFQFCLEENGKQMSACKRLWLEKHPPARERITHHREAAITFDAHLSRCWYRGQFISAAGKTPTARIPSRRYWCAECRDYLVKDHGECKPPVVLSQALSVNLLNVWKPLPLEWGQLRRLKRNPPKLRTAFELIGDFRMDDEAHQVIVAERAKLIVRDYAPRVIDYTDKPLDYLKEVGTGEGLPFIPWVIAPPSVFVPKPKMISDGVYLGWAEKNYLMAVTDVMDGARCLGDLTVLGMPTELRCEEINYDPRKLTQIADARVRAIYFGKRVGGGLTDDGYSDSDGKDRPIKAAYGRGDLIALAQRLDRNVGRSTTICKRKACGAPFVAVRKGHVYCTENCRKLDWENTKGDN